MRRVQRYGTGVREALALVCRGSRSVTARRRAIRQDPRKAVHLYPAVIRAGRTVDFRVSAKRDVAAAEAFFRKAIKITLDGYAASHRAVRELKADGSVPADAKLRSSRYLNNRII
jgi:transposase-like protein